MERRMESTRGKETTTGKETTVYVGKIPSEITNQQITSILKTCGNLSEWKRTRDIEPPDYKYKPFGFATFETLEGVLAAMRALDGMQLYENVDEQLKARTETLLLNVNQATKIAAEQKEKKKAKKQLVLVQGPVAPEFEEAWEAWIALPSTLKFKERFVKELADIQNEEDLDPVFAALDQGLNQIL